ncbi:MAG: hypothetical protein RTU92_02850 [Candidatus Thorarchaeota archaeon]
MDRVELCRRLRIIAILAVSVFVIGSFFVTRSYPPFVIAAYYGVGFIGIVSGFIWYKMSRTGPLQSKIWIHLILFFFLSILAMSVTLDLETGVRTPVATWEELVNPWRDYREDLNDLAFHNATLGWVVGRGNISGIEGRNRWGVILKTIDGGDSWDLVYYKNSTIPEQVDIADSENIWVMTTKGLLHSSDSGDTWSMNFPSTWYDNSMEFKNSTYGLAFMNRTLYRTLDGGETWVNDTQWPEYRGLFEMQFVGDNHVWGCGFNGIYHSSDSGVTWIRQYQLSTSAISMIDEMTGWSLYSHHLSYTADGTNWASRRPPSGLAYIWYPTFYTDVEFINSQQGWLAGIKQGIVYTPDGGNNWYSQQLPWLWDGINAIDFVNASHGWAVAGRCEIYRTRTGNQLGTRLVNEGYEIDGMGPGFVIPQSTVISIGVVGILTIFIYCLIDNEIEHVNFERESDRGILE